jgi:hypothetical protein
MQHNIHGIDCLLQTIDYAGRVLSFSRMHSVVLVDQ